MNSKQTELEKAKRRLLAKRRKIAANIRKYGHDYAKTLESLRLVDDIKAEDLENDMYNDIIVREFMTLISDTFYMKKAETVSKLEEKIIEHKKVQIDLKELSRIKNQVKQLKLFERGDLNSIIIYLISVIEGRLMHELHDEKIKDENFISFSKYYPCFVIGDGTNSYMVNKENFPYIEDFINKVINFKAYKCFSSGYPLEEPLTIEDLYNLANCFIEELSEEKEAVKK